MTSNPSGDPRCLLDALGLKLYLLTRYQASVAPDELLKTELAPEVRRHLLMFFKETVTNVARHAGATAVDIKIEVDAGHSECPFAATAVASILKSPVPAAV